MTPKLIAILVLNTALVGVMETEAGPAPVMSVTGRL